MTCSVSIARSDRAELAAAGDIVRLGNRRSTGERYWLALRLATTTEAGTLGHSAAWSHGEQATAALCEFVGEDTTLAATMKATAELVRPLAQVKSSPGKRRRRRVAMRSTIARALAG